MPLATCIKITLRLPVAATYVCIIVCGRICINNTSININTSIDINGTRSILQLLFYTSLM